MLQKSVDGVSTARWIGSIGLAAVVGIAYFLAARLSLFLLTQPEGVAVFWPAAGIASGALMVFGRDARLPVAVATIVATILANVLSDRTIWAASAKALCNAGEALLVAGLIERYFGSRFNLDRLTHVLGLLAAAIVATAVSGMGGTAAIKLLHSPAAPLLNTWYEWFASDLLGILTIAPLLVGLAAAVRNPPPRSELIEGAAALVTLAGITGVIVFLPPVPWKTGVPIAMLFPLLLWLSARCRPVFASAAAFIVSLTIVLTITFGIGHFGNPDLPIGDRIVTAQAGIVSVALCAFVLAALFAERRQHAAALIEGEARLQEALSAGGVTAFAWDLRTGMTRRSENAAQMLGFDPKHPPSAAAFLARIHPDDLARYKALLQRVSPDRPSFAWSFRFTRFDGREIWLEQASRGELDAAGQLVHVRGLTLDVTERKRAQEHQDTLMAELDHRVRNVLARVAVVAMSTRKSSSSMDDFVRRLNGRIQAMAVAHSVLSQSRWYGAGLTELVRQQLAPYTTDANTTISGSDVMLTAEATQALAMVLHELVTNAAKYGALSSPNGRVSVHWDRHSHRDSHGDSSGDSSGDSAASLTIEWREFGGPAIVAPIQSGYGTNLIRELIPHELGGRVDLVFAAEGACCRIEIPLPPEVAPGPTGTAVFLERPVSV
jgi:PAS domain S-box-containing protein